MLTDNRVLLAAGLAIPVAYYLFTSKPRRAPRSSNDFEAFLNRHVEIGPETAAGGPAVNENSFESFLKVDTTAQHRETDFESFLKALPSSAPRGAGAAQAASAPQATGDHIPVCVLYGTEFGFSKEIGEKLCAKLKETGPYW